MADEQELLSGRIAGEADDNLLRMVRRDYADYTREALEMARVELGRRGYPETRLTPETPSTGSFQRMTDALDHSRINLTTTDFAVPAVMKRLQDEGLDDASAAEMAKSFADRRSLRRRRVGERNMSGGAMMAMSGAILSLLSYVEALTRARSGSPVRYLVFSGLILGGNALFLIGLVQRRRSG